MTVVLFYGDLLGLEYRVDEIDVRTGYVNCAGVCRVILERLGYDPLILPATPAEVSLETLKEDRDRWEHRWEHLGADVSLARELGDTIPSMTREGAHVHTVVQEDPPRVISAAKDHGVYTIRPSLITGALGVWRPRGEAAL